MSINPMVLRQRHNSMFILHREGMAPIATLGRHFGDIKWILTGFNFVGSGAERAFDDPIDCFNWLVDLFPELTLVWKSEVEQGKRDFEANAKIVAAFYEKHPENKRW